MGSFRYTLVEHALMIMHNIILIHSSECSSIKKILLNVFLRPTSCSVV